jgi:polyisoprenoid-binding protein YceI
MDRIDMARIFQPSGNMIAGGVACAGIFLGAGRAAAAQVWSDPADVRPGAYRLEPGHTQVVWGVSHLGLTTYYGVFSGASGSLRLDPVNAAVDSLSVSIPVASVSTTSAVLNDKLKSAEWLDAARYPTMEFVSTRIVPTGRGLALVAGTLTLHGVTRPATLNVKFNGAAINPLDRAYTVGFAVSGEVRRSEFGVTKLVPIIGDDVTLIISAAFEAK